MARTQPWGVDDELWEQVAPLVAPAPSHAKGGRQRMPDRQAFAAILYVLRTGIPWNAPPRELGADSTVHDRFQGWARAGFFLRLWEAGLLASHELVGIDWAWQAADGAMAKAPCGGEAAGPSPTDRGKRGTKRSLLTEGAGTPLPVVVEGANHHAMQLLAAPLDGIVVARPEPTAEAPQHLCLDAGYDFDATRAEVAQRGYLAPVRPRGEERALKERAPGWRARRWVVERSFAWTGRFRRLLVRWEKHAELYLAFVHLACAQLIFSKLARRRRADAGVSQDTTTAALQMAA